MDKKTPPLLIRHRPPSHLPHPSVHPPPSVHSPPTPRTLPRHILGIPYSDAVGQRYKLGRPLGEGTAGVVRTCVDLRTNEVLACKTMPKSRMTSAAEIENVRTEVRALQSVGGHGAVVGMRRVVEDEENVHLIMEHCSGGDLFEKISKKKRFSEEEAAKIVLSLASMLQFCHQRGIMHRDLKPENVLLTSANSDTSVKVVDFGQAAFFTPGVPQTVGAGSQYYIAPEVLKCSYGPEADLWSLGVILYILLSGVPPFYGETAKEVFAKINTGVFNMQTGPWKTISCDAKDLVRRLLCYAPKNRITAEDAQGHPWILKHCRRPKERTPASPPISNTPFLSKERLILNPNSVLDLQNSDPDSPSTSESENSPNCSGSRGQFNKNCPMYDRKIKNQGGQISGNLSISKSSSYMGLPPKSKSSKSTLSHMSQSFPMSKARIQQSENSPDRILSDKQFRAWNHGYESFSLSESPENVERSKEISSTEILDSRRNEKESNSRKESNCKSNLKSKNSEWSHRSASELIAAVAEKLRPEKNLNNLFSPIDGSKTTSLALELEGLHVEVEFDQKLQSFGIYFR